MSDIPNQLRRYARAATADVPATTVEDVRRAVHGGETSGLPGQRWILAAAAAVIVVAVAVGLLTLRDRGPVGISVEPGPAGPPVTTTPTPSPTDAVLTPTPTPTPTPTSSESEQHAPTAETTAEPLAPSTAEPAEPPTQSPTPASSPSPTTSDDPERPPSATLDTGETQVEMERGSYCWSPSGEQGATCADSVGPNESTPVVEVESGQHLTVRFETDGAPEYAEVWIEPTGGGEEDVREIPASNPTSFTADVEPGRYDVILSTQWDQGDAQWYVRLDVTQPAG